jgi:hypothetical protein
MTPAFRSRVPLAGAPCARAAVAIVPLLALAFACLDSVILVAAGQMIAAAGLR